MGYVRLVIFVLVFIACFTGLISPPVALTLGILFGLILTNPLPKESRTGARWLLQLSVVALGFGMNLHEVLKAGRNGFVYTALGIGFSFVAGLSLAKLFKVGGNCGYLITTGTAICGGSAIAAVGPILNADAEEMAISLGTVFVLNSVALLIFPPLGHLLKLSQTAIRIVGRAGDSRHKFRRGSGVKIWGRGAGDRHDGETGTGVVDRAAGAGDGGGETQQVQDPVSVVHSFLLSGRGAEYLFAGVFGLFSLAV